MTADDLPPDQPVILKITPRQLSCAHEWWEDERSCCKWCEIRFEDWTFFNELTK